MRYPLIFLFLAACGPSIEVEDGAGGAGGDEDGSGGHTPVSRFCRTESNCDRLGEGWTCDVPRRLCYRP